ncbi:MAG: hypothetical protein EPN68_02320 [Rhodanobacter sp.]|nr:MAG: hypothetical protein EPN68_02320 [Rhodanobacter sp.]
MSRLEGLWHGPAGVVPELHGFPPRRRRVLWREAVSRSARPARILAQFAIRALAALVLGWLGHMLWPAVSILWGVLIGLMVGGVISDLAITRPAARRWLREHAHELNRYATS